MGKLSTNSKSYKTAAILFSISGFILIVVGVVSIYTGKIPIFIPIGIALVVISMVFWQQRKKMINYNEDKP